MKIYTVIRTIGEPTLSKCVKAVRERNLAYVVLNKKESLEEKVKKTIGVGSKVVAQYDWVMALDADVELTMSKEEIEDYCDKMDARKVFCFTGYVDCTKRGLIDGLHFYKTEYCEKLYELIKDKDFSYRPGRAEFEMVQMAMKSGVGKWEVGYLRVPFGIHYWKNKK